MMSSEDHQDHEGRAKHSYDSWERRGGRTLRVEMEIFLSCGWGTSRASHLSRGPNPSTFHRAVWHPSDHFERFELSADEVKSLVYTMFLLLSLPVSCIYCVDELSHCSYRLSPQCYLVSGHAFLNFIKDLTPGSMADPYPRQCASFCLHKWSDFNSEFELR